MRIAHNQIVEDDSAKMIEGRNPALGRALAPQNLPQTCHKPKQTEKENAGFKRVTADRYLWQKPGKLDGFFTEYSAKLLF